MVAFLAGGGIKPGGHRVWRGLSEVALKQTVDRREAAFLFLSRNRESACLALNGHPISTRQCRLREVKRTYLMRCLLLTQSGYRSSLATTKWIAILPAVSVAS